MKRSHFFKAMKQPQAGFNLIELMVAILIGLIILAAVVGLFVSMIKSDSDNLKAIRLNQELRSTMSLIVRDIRRAGSDGSAATRATGPYPFSTTTTRLTISPNAQANANACVSFAYDQNKDGVDDGNAERFGYRWDSAEGAVEVRQTGLACNATGWENFTDESLIDILGLNFSELAVVEGGMYIRQITVTLRGRLRKDNTVSNTIAETIKIRNEDTGP
jgi:prepilin-type N-terminal cleavage/methylation domain-containing protein